MIYLIALFTFFIRALPRLLYPNALVADTFFHMYCAKVISDNSLKIPRRLPRIILNHEYTYPFLYHLLLALFPCKFRAWAERLTGAVFDTVNVVLVYLFSSWAVDRSGLPGLQGLPIWVAAFFAFSPALLRIGSGPRAYNGSPRVMGQTLYLIHILSSYYALSTRSWLALIAALLAGGGVIVTAKFGNQVLLFFGIFLGLFFSFQYLLLLGGSVLVSLLIWRKQGWRVIVGQIRHSLFYFRHLQRIYLHRHLPSLKGYIKSAAARTWGILKNGELKGAVEWYFSEPQPLHLLMTVYPQFLLVPVFLLRHEAMGLWDRFVLVWAGAALFCFLATKIKLLLFLGEGERYLEYALFPSLWLGVRFCLENREFLLWGFLAYFMVSALYYAWAYHRTYRRADEEFGRTGKAFAQLNRMPPGVIMPIGSFQWQTLYWSSFPVLTYGGNVDERLLPSEEFLLVYGSYPYPSEHFARIVTEYDVSYIVSDKDHINYYSNKILRTPEDFYGRVKPLHQSPTLMIFQALKA